ncbi:bifunctional demethylmenaquinone methyltransferase/2-methoxy-6-polyprenyl-1,4-benzoquinol methylase UbiE [Candidatus Pelagibacter sp.]|uniref:bifunctional demethylmenaquinone methyltransferase/2-methoxy-6-polyprenyl-1,4-benzoquinol methylase UbiE n=1 Tax=Candidatus Pelagibacter sp. TaxID=2024849 RepID=UPI003F851B32
MQQNLQNKKGLVENVFNQVYNKYDLMNDFMSMGVHRYWKKSLINMMNPRVSRKLIDVACGTGDVGKLFLDSTNKEAEITCVDPNKGMVSQGKEKLSDYKNVKWVISPAEKLPITDNSFDYYTISFGLRNTKNLNKALSEAYRVLKPGGRYLCLEFSKIQNSNLDFVYKNYSKLIPIIGKFVVGEKEPYEYLIKSIEQFINQDELIELMEKNNFRKCSYRNLSGGIVSIHSGWKI